MLPHNKIYLSRAQTKSMSAYEPIGDPTGGAAYGEFNDPMTAAFAIGGSLLAADMQSNAAESASNTQAAGQQYSADLQAKMLDKQLAQQKEMFDAEAARQTGMFNTLNEQQRPYREAGYSSLSDISAMKPYLQHQFNAQDFQEGMDPGYAFRLKMGQDQAQRQANLGGGALSGNALAGLQDYTQGSASQEYGNAFNRYQTQRGNIYNTLASIAGLGGTSLGQTGSAGTSISNSIAGNSAQTGSNMTTNAVAGGANIGNAYGNMASAQAAGTIGSANALAGGLQNAGNTYALSNLLKPQSFSDASGWSRGGSGMVNVPGQGSMSIGDYFAA